MADHRDDMDTSFIKNPDVAHEESDVNIRPIAWFMIWLAVASAVVMLLMKGMYAYLDDQAKKQDARQRTALADERNPIPPQPLLQLAPTQPGLKGPAPENNNPMSEVNMVRASEDERLKNYTWLDQSKGVVALPIDRAEELALERGVFKSRPQPAANATSTPPPPPQPEEGGRLQQDQGGRKQGDERH